MPSRFSQIHVFEVYTKMKRFQNTFSKTLHFDLTSISSETILKEGLQ